VCVRVARGALADLDETQLSPAQRFTNGGCPAFVPHKFQGANDALLNITDAGGQFNPNSLAGAQQTRSFTGLPRIGHELALQRSSLSTPTATAWSGSSRPSGGRTSSFRHGVPLVEFI
jgi:hypothetical protein